ncbi:Peptidase A24A prepilin type IV [uncultured Desulfatiglans sp.]|nr:Peptidase A24A prepilin type IV [uncultured Desulfatiglans sp.]
MLFPDNIYNISYLYLAAILLLVAFRDFRVQKIPNLITYGTMAAAMIFHSILNGIDGLLFSVGGLAAGIGLFLLPYLLGVMGAGDTKLLGAIGAVLGAKSVVLVALFTAVCGGIYAAILLVVKRDYARKALPSYATTLKTFFYTRQFSSAQSPSSEPKPKLFYGIAIAAGTFIFMLFEITGYRPISW